MNVLGSGIRAVGMAVFLTACSGGGGGGSTSPPQTAEGRFIDSSVEGLDYVSEEQSGITGQSGSFIYEAGGSVDFSMGGVKLGFATGSEIITPVDMTLGNSIDTETLNIVRFCSC